MPHSNRIPLRSICGLAAVALALAGCASFAGTPSVGASAAQASAKLGTRDAKASQDLYIGNILGGVPLFSTGKDPHEVGDITNGVPRVTGVWVDQKGVLYAFTDNAQYPYETIEEFEAGGTSPFFSLVLKHYGGIVAADSSQNVYAQGEDSQGQQVIDEYASGSQNIANEYVVPSIGRWSAPESMAFDSTGTLLVGVAALAENKQGQIGAVFRLDAGSSTFVNLNLTKASGGLIAVDGAGRLYVGGGRLISVYAAGATKPSRIVHLKEPAVALTVSSNGTLYVGTYNSGITVYGPGKNHSNDSFIPQAQVSGLALGPG